MDEPISNMVVLTGLLRYRGVDGGSATLLACVDQSCVDNKYCTHKQVSQNAPLNHDYYVGLP
jgi:hypothetical protein